jgi:hypothetical protein
MVACTVGDEPGGGGGGGGGGDDDIGMGSGSGSGEGNGETGISGHITADTTWQGDVLIGGITTIDSGVTVTVAAGTTLTLKAVASIQVSGILDAQGTAAAPIHVLPEQSSFGGVTVNGGGEVRYAFVEQKAGPLLTNSSGKATLVDVHGGGVAGDFLLMNGGTLDMTYSQIGLAVGMQDTTHCDLHLGGSGNVIKVNHSNIGGSQYGVMFYGGMNADFTMNNWYTNAIDVDLSPMSPVTGDFSNGWFEKGAPSGSGITASTVASAQLPACDGSNDSTCAGPHW